MPLIEPLLASGRVGEEGEEVFVGAGEGAEGEGEVEVVGGHEVEEGLDGGPVGEVGEAEFTGEGFLLSGLVEFGELFEAFFGGGDGFFFIGVDNGEEGFGEAGEVPEADGGLVVVGVATLFVDEAKFLGGVEVVHEGAGAVVDGVSGEAHVVGIHDAVDEAEAHPLGDEGGLAGDDVFQEVEGVAGLGVVAGVGVVDEVVEVGDFASGGEVLYGADAEVGAGDAGEDASGFEVFAVDFIA